MGFKCPECGSERIAGGRVFSQPDYVAPGAYFRPRELKPFALVGINIRFDNRFSGCLDCGFIWAKVNSQKLTGVIASKGNKSIKDRLGLSSNQEDQEQDDEDQESPEDLGE